VRAEPNRVRRPQLSAALPVRQSISVAFGRALARLAGGRSALVSRNIRRRSQVSRTSALPRNLVSGAFLRVIAR